MFDKLFAPIKIRGMELRNRIIMPAMGTRMASETGEITGRLIAYHTARAIGGSGLNIVEVASVHTPSAPAHFVSISDDSKLEGHTKLTAAIHAAGGKAGIQLWQGSIAVSMDPKAKMFVVSDMPFGKFTVPAITKSEIEEIVECYGAAAKRAAEAGYDCVEFHCAHNYLPHSFLSAGFNRRTDEYGGSFENRARFPLECIRAIRANLPDSMPIFMRIDAHDDYLQNGLSIEDVIAFCKLAGDAGVDVLDISRGNIITAASLYEVPPIDVPRGFNVENARRIRRETGMLTVAVGRINAAEQAEEILEQDKADMVVMGRAQLADPEFANKAKAGRVDDIVHCVGCDQGCYDGFCDVANRPFITCMRNPQIGHEEEWPLTLADNPKKVLIAGGGMAGMETAMVLKKRGHKPVIGEESDKLGGQFLIAGRAPGKAEMTDAAISFGEQVMRAGIKVRFNTSVSAAVLDEEKPDEVVIAIGATPIVPKLDGMDKKPCYQAQDVLSGKEHPMGSVCIIGGGLVGMEAADALATEGHSVTVLEMREIAGADLGSLRKIAVMQKMAALKVNIKTKTTCVGISENGVSVDCGGVSDTVPCDSVVLAIGARPNDSEELVGLCCEKSIPCHIIGDAKKARRALDAIYEGFEIARNI
ncbi:MAG: NAD(P)/FAD-dependent oxidoreductase [Oscillospiraceae bacterium]